MQPRSVIFEMFPQILHGILDRYKLVPTPVTSASQLRRALPIKAGAFPGVENLLRTQSNRARPGKIKADFHTVRVKTFSPIQLGPILEIMPLEADPS